VLGAIFAIGCGGVDESSETDTRVEAILPAIISCPMFATCFVVTNTLDSGAGSLRRAIRDANAAIGRRIIKFDIPGAGPHQISPLTALPELGGNLEIDGFSQAGAAPATETTPPVIEIVISGLLSSGQSALDLEGEGNLVQGLAIGDFAAGAAIRVHGDNNVIRGNLLGVDALASVARPNDFGVLSLSGANNNLVGGSDIADRNVLSGNTYEGVFIMGSDNEVYGNAIGTNFDGSLPLGNGGNGVALFEVGTELGGTGDGEPNLIAHNALNGIIVGLSGLEITLSQNSVHDNGGLGIDLEADGLTANDGLLDLDSGTNGLQNFPELNGATLDPTTEFDGKYKAEVDWQLESEPNTKFRVEFFASAACDASGHGEGERFIGSRAINTDPTGFVQNVWVLPGRVAPDEVITATATQFVLLNGAYAAMDTSEFSECLTPSLCPENVCEAAPR
jgi:hypothetical protein